MRKKEPYKIEWQIILLLFGFAYYAVPILYEILKHLTK